MQFVSADEPHDVPEVAGALWHPSGSIHVSTVQALPSLQFGGVPGTTAPPEHVSTPLQNSPSLGSFELSGVNTHAPDTQVSSVHGLESLHSDGPEQLMQPTMGVPAHPPPEQTSFSVHELESSQASVLFMFSQPVAGLHESLVHGFPSLQSASEVSIPAQTPISHSSLVVQASPSSHGVPSDPMGCVQEPA